MTIIRDGETTLDEVLKLNVEDQCVRLVVANKLFLEPTKEKVSLGWEWR
jgi:hypothetical protein